jgi:pimeloyl-ACP methyl ester carboxylesterase
MEGSGFLFQPLISILPKNITPIVISYPSDESLSYQQLTGLIRKQLPEGTAYILLAESFSGPIAYQIALQRPENLKAVILVGSFLSKPDSIALNLFRFKPFVWFIKQPLPNIFIRTLLLGPKADPMLIDLFRKAMSQVTAEVLICRINEMLALPEHHESCNVPAVYLQATDDKLVGNGAVQAFKQALPKLKVFQIPASHFILQVNPQASLTIILELIEELINSGPDN